MVTLSSNYKLLFSAAKAVVDVGPDMSQQSCAMTAGLYFLQDQGGGGGTVLDRLRCPVVAFKLWQLQLLQDRSRPIWQRRLEGIMCTQYYLTVIMYIPFGKTLGQFLFHCGHHS